MNRFAVSSTSAQSRKGPEGHGQSNERCCICIEVKPGSIAIAVFYMVLYSVTAVLSVVVLADGDLQRRFARSICFHMKSDGECKGSDVNSYEKKVQILGGAGFVISVLALPVAATLIYGVLKIRPCLIMPLFVWNIADTLRDTICFFTVYKLWGALPEYFVPVFVVTFFILQAMRGYFISALWSVYRQLKSEKRDMDLVEDAQQDIVDSHEHHLLVGAFSEKTF